jgi:hypothetical protein
MKRFAIKKNKSNRNKKAIEMGFNWLFAIIAGGTFLFIAFFVSTKIAGIGGISVNTGVAASLEALLEPMETGQASGKATILRFRKESKFIFSECYSERKEPFGEQKIRFTEKVFNEKFSELSEPISVENKYIFAKEELVGKDFYIFSKSLFLPYKVSDLIMISTETFCFVDAPDEIKRDIRSLDITNFILTDDIKNCTENIVCFDENKKECDIKIFGMCDDIYQCRGKYDYGRIVYYNKEVYYVSNLIYAAIVSRPELYECNIRRLSKRLNRQSYIYLDKIKVIERKDCINSAGPKIEMLASYANDLTSSKQLLELYKLSKEVNSINIQAKTGCKLYNED